MGNHLKSYIFLDLDLPNITLVRAILIFKFHVPRAIIFSFIAKTLTQTYTLTLTRHFIVVFCKNYYELVFGSYCRVLVSVCLLEHYNSKGNGSINLKLEHVVVWKQLSRVQDWAWSDQG